MDKKYFFLGTKQWSASIEEQWDNVVYAASLLITDEKVSSERLRAASIFLKFILPDYLDLIESEMNVRDRHDRRVRQWRREVIERDAYSCVKCKAHTDLHAHHIVPWSDYPKGRIDINNGITLCETCHSHEHKDIGYFVLSGKGRKARGKKRK